MQIANHVFKIIVIPFYTFFQDHHNKILTQNEDV